MMQGVAEVARSGQWTHEMLGVGSTRRNVIKAVGSAAGLALVGNSQLARLASAQDAEPTGTVTYLTSSNFIGNWNPYANLVLSHMRAQRMVYDYLMWFDEEGGLVPGLAESFENVDPTTWEVKLRQGVKFHDGQDFTARDVKASVELASNPNSVTGSLFPGQLSVEIVDDFTARIVTPTPFAALQTGTLAGNQSAAIISHLDAEKGEEFLSQKMNGTGGFKWVSYEGEAGGLRLTANTDYWRGLPKVKDVVIQYVGDPSTRLAALQSGQADIIESVGPDEAQLLEGSGSFQVIRTPSTDSVMIGFRTTKPPLDNPLLRQAISYAIDVPSITEDIMLGYAAPNQAFIPSITLYFEEDPNYFTYDPEKAKSLLAEAGFADGSGLPALEIIVPVGFYPKTSEIAQYMAQNLQEVGITLNVTTMEVSAWTEALFQHDVGDMIMHGWLVPTPDRQSWYTSLFRTAGLISGFSNPEVDQIIKEQAEAIDPAARAEIIQDRLEPILVENVPEFPMFTYELVTGVSPQISGLTIPPWYEFDMLPVAKSE
jgi:peptide/nickel transport system substrate-binding protein